MVISRDIANRILCLPVYAELKTDDLFVITDIINDL